MRRLDVLNISDIDATPTVGQATSTGLSNTTPSAESAHGRGLLRVEEAAVWLGLSKRTMYELLNRGEIESVHIGRSRRIPFAALERFVEHLSARAG
jgi:excisionase family DNA binding protein